MKDFFEKPKLKSDSHRNPFDLSFQYQNTLPFGAILPVGCWRVNAGDKLRINNELQLVCEALVRPAFTRMKVHTNYYFVPATQIMMYFDNFITGQDSYFSQAVKNVAENDGSYVPNNVPVFDATFLSSMFQDMSNRVDELGYNLGYGAARVLDSLNYGNFCKLINDGVLDDPAELANFVDLPNMNLFALAAYQKVYYDYFRNPLYENNDTEAYNFDDIAPSKILTSNDWDYGRFGKLFRLRYRWLKRDYFTQVQPNSMVSASQLGYSGLSTNLNNQNNLFGVPGMLTPEPFQGNYTNTNYNMANNNGAAVSVGINKQGSSVGSLAVRMTTASIRTAFAFDRLLRRMREAGADFDKQMMAQYGIAPYDARHGKCYHIGGYVNQIATNSITNSTGFTSGNGEALGDLAGQINFYATNTDKKQALNYHVREMGYVICVMSISNENTYQSYRIDRMNTARDRFDWYNEVFEDLGLQPLFQYELDYTDQTVNPINRGKTVCIAPKQIIGYVRRYSEYKTRPDEIHGNLALFSDVADGAAWNMQYFRNNWQSGQFGTGALNKSDLIEDPGMMNSVSGVQYNGDPRTDQFKLNMYHHMHIVSNMTRLGENF